ncbi:MAG TPA: MarR family transcriptional regulator [Anaerolineaceae bacterium]|nr:MarR family transcriptional regulator [Anaerolineaceae bacterium]
MDEANRTERVNDILQAYLALGDALRLSALPSWVSADLSMSQVKAIVLLEYHGALTVSELARQLGLGNPAASTLVQQLVELGLVERSEDTRDRRRTYVRPTAQGIRMITGRREYIKHNLTRWLSQLTDEELAGLQQGYRALFRVLEAEQAQDGKERTLDTDKHG